jgi:hypothetical protein
VSDKVRAGENAAYQSRDSSADVLPSRIVAFHFTMTTTGDSFPAEERNKGVAPAQDDGDSDDDVFHDARFPAEEEAVSCGLSPNFLASR